MKELPPNLDTALARCFEFQGRTALDPIIKRNGEGKTIIKITSKDIETTTNTETHQNPLETLITQHKLKRPGTKTTAHLTIGYRDNKGTRFHLGPQCEITYEEKDEPIRDMIERGIRIATQIQQIYNLPYTPELYIQGKPVMLG